MGGWRDPGSILLAKRLFFPLFLLSVGRSASEGEAVKTITNCLCDLIRRVFQRLFRQALFLLFKDGNDAFRELFNLVAHEITPWRWNNDAFGARLLPDL